MTVNSVAGAGNLALAQLALRQSLQQEKQVVQLVTQANQQLKAATPSPASGRGSIVDIFA